MPTHEQLGKPAFCIFIDTVCEGRVPLIRDENSRPVLFTTQEAAEREIAEDVIARLQEFLDGKRDFEDAMTVEEYILEVDVFSDGSITDQDGNVFG